MYSYTALFQSKFCLAVPPDPTLTNSAPNPPHGISLPVSPVVVLSALGYIGFKVIDTTGNIEVNIRGLLVFRFALR